MKRKKEILQGLINDEDWECRPINWYCSCRQVWLNQLDDDKRYDDCDKYLDECNNECDIVGWSPVSLGDAIKDNYEYRQAQPYFVYQIGHEYQITQECLRMLCAFAGTKTQCEQYVNEHSWSIVKVKNNGLSHFEYILKKDFCEFDTDENREFIRYYYGSDHDVQEFIDLTYSEPWLTKYINDSIPPENKNMIIKTISSFTDHVLEELATNKFYGREPASPEVIRIIKKCFENLGVMKETK